MLIAIMGETFASNHQIAEAKKIMSQLAFVVDNWWIDPVKDKEKIVYFVAAFPIEDENDSDEKLDEINENMHRLEKLVTNLANDVKNIQYQVSQIH